jgi:putative ABC transport system permease protein
MMIRGKRVLDDLDEEIRAHLERETQDNLARGLSPEEARQAAYRKFGNVTLAKENARAVWVPVWLDQLRQDVQYAVRALRRNPGFTVVAVLTLALGIGASIALFSVLDAVLLRPLPFRDPSSLFAVWERPPLTAQWKRQTVPYPLFLEWQRHANSFDDMADFTGRDFTLALSDRPELVRGDVVGPRFFVLLGIRPVYGRTILPGDLNGGPVVVLSYRLWTERFGGDPAIIDTSITLNGLAHTVVGILPFETSLPILEQEPTLWTLLKPDDPELVQRAGRVAVLGRLRADVTAPLAQSELATIQGEFQKQQPAAQRAEGVIVRRLQEDRAETIRPTLLLVTGAVGALLLISCANVASLLLGRSLQRTREMAVRAAMGASRARLGRQLVTELTVLWSLGGALGVALGAAGIRWFATSNPFRAEELPAQTGIGIDARAVAFACAVTLVTAVMFGVLSALQGARLNLVESLKATGRGSTLTRSTQRWRTLLVGAEMSLSVLLLAGAGLLITSLARLGSQPLGFQPEGVLTFTIQLPQHEYPTDTQRIQFHRALLARLRALPGVESVGTTSARPLGGIVAAPFTADGPPPPSEGPPVWSGQQVVDSDYFRAMRIPVLRGRAFDDRDTERGEPVVIINETLARKYFPGQDPVGHRIKHGTPAQNVAWMRIIGVVKDVKHAGLEWEVLPETFVPYSQVSGPYAKVVAKDIVVALRSHGELLSQQSAIRGTVWSIDQHLPIVDLNTAAHLVSESADRPRFRTWLVTAFATIALLLASVGLYGVLSQAVVHRQREFGIRMALGATRTTVLRLVLGQGMRLAAVGAAVGIVAILTAARVVASVLYGVSANDPRILTGVVALMLLVAALASVIPARRATGIDPLVALRCD